MYIPFIYTFYKYIYKYIWTNQYDQCLSMVVLYIYRFFCSSCPSCGGMLSYGHLIETACCIELSWGLNVNHWLVAVIASLFTVLSLCSGSAHTASCTTSSRLWPSFCSFFFNPLCTSIYSLKGDKVFFFVIDDLKTSGRCCKEIMFLLFVFFTGMYDFCFTHVGTQV